MKRVLIQRLRIGFIGVCSLFLIVLLAACSGVVSTGTGTVNGTPGTTGSNQIQGIVTSVDAANGKVTLNVNGQTITVSGLTAQQVQALQAAQNKNFSFQVNPGGGQNAYVISPNTEPQENNNGTPEVPPTNNGTIGSIQFTGQVQSSSNSNITVNMPGGQSLQINIVNGTTNLEDFNGAAPGNGQLVKVEAFYTNGNFVANKLSTGKSEDQNTVEYKGIATSAVGSDGKLNFTVGNKSYSFPITTTTDLKDFGGNAQSIQANTQVKVKVLYNGSTGTVQSVDNSNGSN